MSYNNLTQPGNKSFPYTQKRSTHFTLNYNRYTFNGLESLATRVFHAVYSPQANVTVHQNGNILSVDAGGTLSNNTYKWFKVGGSSTTINGDSIFTPANSGMYYVKITNAIATKLTLTSDTIDFTPINLLAGNRLANNANSKNFNQGLNVFPNPAKNAVHIQINGSANIVFTNGNGKTLLTKHINNSGEINVSKFAEGTYYITNKTTGKVQKIVVVH